MSINHDDIASFFNEVNTTELLHASVEERESEYCTYHNYRFFVGSWNVNGRFEEQLAIDDWLQSELPEAAKEGSSATDMPHVYVLGFQELHLSLHSMAVNKSTSSPQEERWLRLIEKSATFARAPYRRLMRSRLAAIFLVVYVQESCWAHVRPDSVLTAALPTGMFNMIGNKGAAAITFQFHDSLVCFLSVHLAAGESNIFRRNQDFQMIMTRLIFNSFVLEAKPLPRLEEHDVLFIFGDMNYRITLEPEITKKLIEVNDIEKLLLADELSKVRREKGNIFSGFNEGNITFAPTYKFDPNTNDYDTSEKNRIPSYCDRILWRSKHKKFVEILSYSSCPTLAISDHKPVFANFNVSVKRKDEEAYRRVYERIVREMDGKMNAILPQATLDTHDLNFGDVRMLEAKQAVLNITNVGRSAFTVSFGATNDSTPALPEWLTTTGSRHVKPGETLALTFEAYINPKFVRKFYSNEYTVEDVILIMKLQGGKHFFLTTHGSFVPTSYGLPLAVLVDTPEPVAYTTVQRLQEKIAVIMDKTRISMANSENDAVDGQSKELPSSQSIVVPKEIFRMVDHLHRHGLTQAELFRQPGVHAEQQLLRLSLDTGGPFDPLPSGLGIHTVAEALLTFLDSLYEPVIPAQWSSLCLVNTHDVHASTNALQHLPLEHLHLFVYLMSFMRELLQNAHQNGVDIKLISEVFGDIMFRDFPDRVKQSTIIRQFLTNFLLTSTAAV